MSDERLDYLALEIVKRIDEAASIPAAAQALINGLRPLGALSMVATDTLVAPLQAGDDSPPAIVSITPAGWEGSPEAAFTERANPNPSAARLVQRPFLWASASLPTKALYGAYWEALGAFGAVEGIAVPVRETGSAAGVSLALATADWSRRERRAMEFACYAFISKVRELSPAPPDPPKLTPRQRDCIAYVSEGKTDWEISVIMGISQSTAHLHVEAARRKLGAVNRAQAVARFLLLGLM